MTKIPNPYPGAKPLSEEHPHLLLGRDDLVREFAGLLRRFSVIEVAGPSGVGKSSFLAAGLCGRLDRETPLIVRCFAAWSELPEEAGTVFYAEALRAALRSGSGPHQPRIDEFLARPDVLDPSVDPFAFVQAVDDELGRDLVVVYDQLEELLRDDPDVGREFLTNVRDIASELDGGFTQVVSLREEYVANLKVIEENLHPSLWRYKVIGGLGADVIGDLVRRPLLETATDGAAPVTATDDLVQAMENAWLLARADPPDLASIAGDAAIWPRLRELIDEDERAVRHTADESRPGLLHLQALLHAMFEKVDPLPGTALDPRAVAEEMEFAWPSQPGRAIDPKDDPRSSRTFWAERLEQYVDLELERRRDEFCQRSDHPDQWLVAAETQRVAACLPEHLSSAGYKLVRSTDGLAATVLTQMRDLHLQLSEDDRRHEERAWAADGKGAESPPRFPKGMAVGRDAGQQVQPLTEELARTCRTLKAAQGTVDAEAVASDVVSRFPGLARWGDDEMVAGRRFQEAQRQERQRPLECSAALLTACDLVVTFERALQWLEESCIIRMTQTRSNVGSRVGTRMVSIVHDGFGEALVNWAARVIDDPVVEIALPVAVTGKQVFYRPDLEKDDQALTPEVLPTTDHLGWIGCNVTAYFEGITFRNCDLRSTLFMRCRFVDVTLEDCLTAGLLFIDCTFEGSFTIRSTRDPTARPRAETLKTVTFGAGCRTANCDSRIVVEGYEGYGLFLDGFVGAWEVRDCSFAHLRVEGPPASSAGRGAGPGLIASSPSLRHVVITGHHPHPLVVAGEELPDQDRRLDAPGYLEAPGIDVIYERTSAAP